MLYIGAAFQHMASKGSHRRCSDPGVVQRAPKNGNFMATNSMQNACCVLTFHRCSVSASGNGLP